MCPNRSTSGGTSGYSSGMPETMMSAATNARRSHQAFPAEWGPPVERLHWQSGWLQSSPSRAFAAAA